jgi:hypothetical protein
MYIDNMIKLNTEGGMNQHMLVSLKQSSTKKRGETGSAVDHLLK